RAPFGEVLVEFVDEMALSAALTLLRDTPTSIRLVHVSASFFGYKPVLLRLQAMATIPLGDILFRRAPNGMPPYDDNVRYIIDAIRQANDRTDLGDLLLGGSASLRLDTAQRNSIVHALTHQVCLIQGPPGTGTLFD